MTKHIEYSIKQNNLLRRLFLYDDGSLLLYIADSQVIGNAYSDLKFIIDYVNNNFDDETCDKLFQFLLKHKL